MEGIIKPLVTNWGKRSFTKLLPKLYELTDEKVLSLIEEKDKDKIIEFIKERILFLEPKLNEKQVNLILQQW